MIGNYKSSQEETISKRKLVAVLHKYVKHEENKNRGKTQEYTDVLSKKPISKIIYKQEQNKAENKRYLFEITLPKVSISYLHHNIERNLATEDIEHLIWTNFKNWKLFIIRTMFRMEFNIHDPIPKKYSERYNSFFYYYKNKIFFLNQTNKN